MPGSDLTQVISSAVVPVVIISACGLLALALYNRLAAIVSRLRGFQRERLEHERNESFDPDRRRKLQQQLHLQTLGVTRRAQLIRRALQFLLLTIGLLICCCLALSISAFFRPAMDAAVALFVLGLLSMLCSTLSAALELKSALEPVELESQFVTEVLKEEQDGDAA